MDDQRNQLTPNQALDELVNQAQELNMGYNMYDTEDKEGLNLETKKEITGYYIEYNRGSILIESDEHCLCDGELSIIRKGKSVAGFSKGMWIDYVYLHNEKCYRHYQQKYFQEPEPEPTPKPDRKWWQFWK